jgi:hypothetical protein
MIFSDMRVTSISCSKRLPGHGVTGETVCADEQDAAKREDPDETREKKGFQT